MRSPLLFALLVAGCAESTPPVVATTKAVSNKVAEALKIAERLELDRVDAVAREGMAACQPTDVDCRMAAVDAAFNAEKPRIDEINRLVQAQSDVAEALVKFDVCANQPDGAECQSDALTTIAQLAPQLAKLIVEAQKAGPPK